MGMKRKLKGRKRLVYIVSLSLAMLLFVLLATQSIFNDEPESGNESKAAIIDGLLHFYDPEFVEEATKILSEAGYVVDYIEGEEVTVDFYRRLPSLGYCLIVLRVHCGPLFRQLLDGTEIPEGTVFFTTEAYDTKKYVNYQVNGLVAVARITGIPDEEYFAVPPWFFERCADGEFQNATVILDSCYGFYEYTPQLMARTLESRGVRVFIGWDGEVQPEHADSAVLVLLRALCIDGLTVGESVGMVMEEVGLDPFYGSDMLFYPLEMGDYRLNIPEG